MMIFLGCVTVVLLAVGVFASRRNGARLLAVGTGQDGEAPAEVEPLTGRGLAADLAGRLEGIADGLRALSRVTTFGGEACDVQNACLALLRFSPTCSSYCRACADDWTQAFMDVLQGGGDVSGEARAHAWSRALGGSHAIADEAFHRTLSKLRTDAGYLVLLSRELARAAAHEAARHAAAWDEIDDELSRRFAAVHALCASTTFTVQRRAVGAYAEN